MIICEYVKTLKRNKYCKNKIPNLFNIDLHIKIYLVWFTSEPRNHKSTFSKDNNLLKDNFQTHFMKNL